MLTHDGWMGGRFWISDFGGMVGRMREDGWGFVLGDEGWGLDGK